MNFLAHAWCLPELEPDSVLGSSLPDLLGAFDRRAPRLAGDAFAAVGAAGHAALGRGLVAHLAADACFHDLPAFREATAALGPLVRDVAARAPVRGFFLAHLLVELLLDAALAAREPDLAARYFHALGVADRPAAARATARVGGNPRDEAGFLAFTDAFLAARSALEDTSDPALVRRAGRVLRRARQDLSTAGGAVLLEGLPAARASVTARLDALLEPPRARVRAVLASGD